MIICRWEYPLHRTSQSQNIHNRRAAYSGFNPNSLAPHGIATVFFRDVDKEFGKNDQVTGWRFNLSRLVHEFSLSSPVFLTAVYANLLPPVHFSILIMLGRNVMSLQDLPLCAPPFAWKRTAWSCWRVRGRRHTAFSPGNGSTEKWKQRDRWKGGLHLMTQQNVVHSVEVLTHFKWR